MFCISARVNSDSTALDFSAAVVLCYPSRGFYKLNVFLVGSMGIFQYSQHFRKKKIEKCACIVVSCPISVQICVCIWTWNGAKGPQDSCANLHWSHSGDIWTGSIEKQAQSSACANWMRVCRIQITMVWTQQHWALLYLLSQWTIYHSQCFIHCSCIPWTSKIQLS